MEKPTTHKELREALTDDRYRILEVLAEYGELRSSKIREYAEIPDGSTHYQLSSPSRVECWEYPALHTGELVIGVPETNAS